VARLLEPVAGAAVGEAAALPVAMVLALLLASSVQMVVGELFPKNYAIARPYPTAVVVTPFQSAFTVTAGPLIHLLNGAANRVLRRMGVEPQEELAAGRPAHELVALVRRSAELGSVDAPTARLMQRAVGLAQHNAADAMTPRVRMVVVRPSASVTDALRLARRTGFSRLPVMERGADEVLGVVHVKAALAVPASVGTAPGRCPSPPHPCTCRRPWTSTGCWPSSGGAWTDWRSWSTSTAGSPAW